MIFYRVSARRPSPWAAVLILVLLLSACQAGPARVSETAATATQPAAAPAGDATSPVQPTAVSAENATAEPPTTTAQPAVPTEPPAPTDTPTPVLTFTPTATKAPKSLKDTENFLVLGMDQRPGDYAWRTDTIIVVAIDHDSNQVGMISVPRDLWVNIPGYGPGRINQADFQGEQTKYEGGGPALAQKVILDNLGIPTQHWVRLKLEALPDLVDALGGVTVTLDCPLHELTPDPAAPDSGRYIHFDLPAGKVTMDGATAAKFARYRYASNDFSRIGRQQQLIWAIKQRALETDIIPKIPDLWKALSKTFRTDLTLLDVIRLARLGATLQPNQVHGVVFSREAMTDAQVGAAWVVKIVSEAQVQKEIASLFEAKSISVQGREGSGGCPTPQPEPTESVTPEAGATATVTPTS